MVVSSSEPGPSTQPPGDPLLRISKLCLVTMPQVETLSTTIFNQAPKPIDDPSTSGVDTCLYGGKTSVNGVRTKFLSITILPNSSGGSHHFAAQTGFSGASAGVVSVNGLSLVTASARITSGDQNGSWLTLTVGNHGPPLVTWKALKMALTEAETQYTASNANSSSSPSASTGGNSSGSSPKDIACKLLTTPQVNQFEPPDTHGLTPIQTGAGTLHQQPGTTDYVCGFNWWSGNSYGSGTEDGAILIDLACGPNASASMVSTEKNGPTFTTNGITAAVGMTRLLGSQGTGNPQQVLSEAQATAQRIHACG